MPGSGFRWSGHGPRVFIFAVFRGGAARINGREARAERQAEIACQIGMEDGF
jgi:hypothetical protein